jgi:dTDP-4-dehydrorhamnose reductase
LKVLVFGPSGMLGHEVVRVLRLSGLEVATAGRTDAEIPFDAGSSDFYNSQLTGFGYIVNCIGLTTHHINVDDTEDTNKARALNTEFPEQLTRFAEENGSKVIQIATDCVYSGSKGSYVESDIHDAVDVYGITKSAGEIASGSVMHIRCSIIGRELKDKKSLLEWVISQPENSEIPGFTDRLWNGITTTAFAKVVLGIIQDDGFRSGTWHLVPKGSVSKFELVSLIARNLGRTDIRVKPVESGIPKDLTLSTNNSESNQSLWSGAGYQGIPTIQELIAEISG